MPWCFAVSESPTRPSPARTSLWSCFEGMGAAVWSWFLAGSEGNVRQWSLLARRRFRPSVPWRWFRPSVAWCFGVAKGAFWRLAAPAPAAPAAAAGPAAELALFLAAAAAGPAAAIAESRRIQKGRQASGQHVFGGCSVLQ